MATCVLCWADGKSEKVQFTAASLCAMLSRRVHQDLVRQFVKDVGEIDKDKFAVFCEYMYRTYFVFIGFSRRVKVWDMAESKLLWDQAVLQSLDGYVVQKAVVNSKGHVVLRA